MTTQALKAGTTRRHDGAVLTRLVDATGIRHIAFETARRTLCLEQFVTHCSPEGSEHGTCETCIDVRKRMKRPRFTKATPVHQVRVTARANNEADMSGLTPGRNRDVSREPQHGGSSWDHVRAGAAKVGTSEEPRSRSAVILDKHPVWLDALSRLLDAVGVELVGQATGSHEAITLVDERHPDLLIAGLDVSEPEQVACVRRAKLAHHELKTVVLADTTDPGTIEAVFVAGASVYCVKTADSEDLAWAVRQALQQSVYIAGNPQSCSTPPMPAPKAADELTRRELEILGLVAEGLSNGQLAKMLWVTEQTVKFHLSNIYRKLHVANRTEASRWAQLNGLLHTSPQKGRLPGIAA